MSHLLHEQRWELHKCDKSHKDNAFCEFQIRRVGTTGISTGQIIGWTNEGRPECEPFLRASGQLMAAAPELLAILKRLTEWEANMGGFEAKVWQDARRVIAKAQGDPDDECSSPTTKARQTRSS